MQPFQQNDEKSSLKLSFSRQKAAIFQFLVLYIFDNQCINIEAEGNVHVQTRRKQKGTETVQEIKITVTAIKWGVKKGVDINARSGVYFLRSCVEAISEQTVWQFYNNIREVEASFYVTHLVMQSSTNIMIDNQSIPFLSLQHQFA